MQKAADAADISVLFFSAGANFWAILGHFWAILAILGHFWAILSSYRSFLGQFLWQNIALCYLNHFLQLCIYTLFINPEENVLADFPPMYHFQIKFPFHPLLEQEIF